MRPALVKLDTLSRSMRNGKDPDGARGRNYHDVLPLTEMLKLCQAQGSAIVVGFMDWRAQLPATTADQLREKSFKYDYTGDEKAKGTKLARNWVPGDLFLEAVIEILARP